MFLPYTYILAEYKGFKESAEFHCMSNLLEVYRSSGLKVCMSSLPSVLEVYWSPGLKISMSSSRVSWRYIIHQGKGRYVLFPKCSVGIFISSARMSTRNELKS